MLGAALAKGGFMLAFGLAVLAEAAYKVFHPVMPSVETMGVIGTIALAANIVCFSLLYRHRADNLNMSSVRSNAMSFDHRRHQPGSPCSVPTFNEKPGIGKRNCQIPFNAHRIDLRDAL